MSNVITCSIEGCNKEYKALKLCSMHYTRLKRYGDVNRGRISPETRFWGKVKKTQTCWLWTGSKNNGYGYFRAGKHVLVHRYAYELLKGEIPEGLHIDHLCRVRNCVNPDHLEPVTLAENNRRVAEARTHCKWGHSFSGDNLFLRKNGERECRTCMRQWKKIAEGK